MKPVSPYSRQTLLVMLVLMLCFWGLNWPVMKVALHYFSAFFYEFLRMAFGALVVGLYASFTRQWRWPTRNALIPIIAVGVLQIAAVNYIMLETLHFVEASRAAILSYSTPIWITPVAIFVFNERYNRYKLLGVLLGIGGVLVMFNPITFNWSAHAQVIASLWLLIAAGIWGMCILLMREYKTDFPMLPMVFWQLLVAAIVLLVPALWWGHPANAQWTLPSTLMILYSGVIATGFSYAAMIIISKYVASITTSLALLATPAMGMVFSRIILGEPLTFTKLLAMGLIGVGVVFVLLADRHLSKMMNTAPLPHSDPG